MILRTENLVKKYRQRTVVNHVSVQVAQGEIVGLPIQEVLGHKRKINQGIYEDVLKLR